MEQTITMNGRVIAVRGAVVDVAFDGFVHPLIEDAPINHAKRRVRHH